MKRVKLLTICLLAAVLALACAAAEDAPAAEGTLAFPGGSGLNTEQMAAGYIDRLFHPSALTPRDPFAVGSRLEDTARGVYDLVLPAVTEIAAGRRASTEIDVVSAFGTGVLTPGDLGVSAIWNDGGLTAEASEALTRFLSGTVNSAMDCVLADCPYELYWYDKTAGYRTGYSLAGSGENIRVAGLTVRMTPAQ